MYNYNDLKLKGYKMLSHKIRITNTKNNLSKIVDLDNYKVSEAIRIFNFYSLHKTYLIEMV